MSMLVTLLLPYVCVTRVIHKHYRFNCHVYFENLFFIFLLEHRGKKPVLTKRNIKFQVQEKKSSTVLQHVSQHDNKWTWNGNFVKVL